MHPSPQLVAALLWPLAILELPWVDSAAASLGLIAVRGRSAGESGGGHGDGGSEGGEGGSGGVRP